MFPNHIQNMVLHILGVVYAYAIKHCVLHGVIDYFILL